MKPKHPVQIEIETKIRSQHKEQSTADAYWGWVKRYFEFCLKNKLGKDVKAEMRLSMELQRLRARLSRCLPIRLCSKRFEKPKRSQRYGFLRVSNTDFGPRNGGASYGW